MPLLGTTPRFDGLYKDLRVADARLNLFENSRHSLPWPDICYLLLTASRFSQRSSINSESQAGLCQKAYEIAICAPNCVGERRNEVALLSDLILSRLGNFPARHLLHDLYDISDLREADPYVAAECMIRELENKLDYSNGTILTDFQVRLLGDLQAKSHVSVSAPTSAGKSFALELELLRLLRSPDAINAVFLVPTRALIRQVSLDLIDIVKRHQLDASILSSPVPPTSTVPNRHNIFVLTQERLATLLLDTDFALPLDAIVIDEAQEIGKQKRGQTLERVLKIAIQKFPNARLFFSSPLRSNPEYLLSLFKRENNASHFIEFQSPVTQNLICLHKVKRQPKEVKASMIIDNEEVELGQISIPFSFRDNCVGRVARLLTKDGDTSIIYCNWQSSAEKVALQIAEEMGEDSADSELEEFATFLQHEVHRLASQN